jgi:hypothetical protein
MQPEVDSNFKSARFNIFRMFVCGNRIPKRTGRPGGLVKLKFDAKKDEFRELIVRYPEQGEVRLPVRGVDDSVGEDGLRDGRIALKT